MLNKGDKIRLITPMGMFTNVGEICDVIDVSDSGVITFKFGNGMHMGCMSADEFKKYFEKYEEPKSESKSVNIDWVNKIINESHINIATVFDKCTVVACKLPSGFVIVESSACVDPKNYDKDLGVEICLNRIRDRVCEMEAYKISDEMWGGKEFYCDSMGDCASCDICADNGGHCTDCYDEDDDEDDDCDGDCENCPFNDH